MVKTDPPSQEQAADEPAPQHRHAQPFAMTAQAGAPAVRAQPAQSQAPGAKAGQQTQEAQPQAQQEVEVPERPALAPNINLKGEMQESAFVNPPWLIEREGGYIQVTKLLYHVAEQANGQRTLEEMARGVSAATGRKVSADNVRQLVAKLIPMGIVLKADGTAAEALKDGGPAPLSVNMKMAMLSPKFIDPVTGVLLVLFWPPVLIAFVIAAAIAQGWMYFVHGVGGSIHDAFYTPGLMLAVLAIIVIVTAFHEFGHATALRKGGGKVGGIGAGIYIVYPAFYTDVTDNYRLSRWPRVRTDLGGIYFNLIFAVGLMALYVLTGQEFLLLVVLVNNLEIIHNLLPFVRLDGYWTLADITGIPDFFSHIPPYLRSVLPKWVPFPKGKEIPELKTWAKWFFGIYILVTVPLLIFLLFLMIKTLPRILATAWDAFWKQTGEFSRGLGDGDFLLVGATVVQMITLALPSLAMMFTLFTLGKRLVIGAWNWSKGSPVKRAAAGVGSAALLGLLYVLWAPTLPFVGGPGPLHNSLTFKPIGKNDRFTVQDLASDTVVTATRSSGLLGSIFGAPTVTGTVEPGLLLTGTQTVVPTGTAPITLSRTPASLATGTPLLRTGTAVTGTQTLARGTITPSPGLTGTATLAATPGTPSVPATRGSTATAETRRATAGTGTPATTPAGTRPPSPAGANTQAATRPVGTNTPAATGASTPRPVPTNTAVPVRTTAPGGAPTNTAAVPPTPTPGALPTTQPTGTAVTAPAQTALPSSTPPPAPTSTPVPVSTSTPVSAPTSEPPAPPSATPTAIPPATATATATATHTITPSPVVTPASTPTPPPSPTLQGAPTP